jgi:hypothetical protein
MTRYASTLLLVGGAALLISIQVSPATSSPTQAALSLASSSDQVPPVLSQVNAEVDRLRARLAQIPTYPSPGRDPFSFGGRRPDAPAPMAPPPPVAEFVPPPVLPRLVAVLSTTTVGGVSRAAAFAVDDDVRIVKEGDRVGAYVVRAITSDAVTLVDVASGAAFRVQ